MVSVSKLLRKGKCLILSYDQGLEHGPGEFNKKNVDPDYVFDIALEGGFTAIATTIGVAEKHYHGPYRDVPLIVKVNGSTNLPHINPISAPICTVERAIKAGASAIGFTLYDGSPNEPEMFEKFGRVCEQAHDYGLPVVVWMYPRGPGIHSMDSEILAYSARIALELGADIVKFQFHADQQNLRWMTRCAGNTKIVISGGNHPDEVEFLNDVRTIMDCGVLGLALGRHIWKSSRPFSVAKAVKAIVFDGKSAATAAQYLK